MVKWFIQVLENVKRKRITEMQTVRVHEDRGNKRSISGTERMADCDWLVHKLRYSLEPHDMRDLGNRDTVVSVLHC
jgi:hypothetical protein